jgi:hypothetical protein
MYERRLCGLKIHHDGKAHNRLLQAADFIKGLISSGNMNYFKPTESFM